MWISWAKVPAVPSGCGCDEGSNEGQRLVCAALAKVSVSWTYSQGTLSVANIREMEDNTMEAEETWGQRYDYFTCS